MDNKAETQMQVSSSGSKKSMISVELADKAALYKAYMPFLNSGGLLVSTEHQYELGDSVFIRLKLPDTINPVPVACKVVWLAPFEVGMLLGVGLQFVDDDDQVKSKIETTLAGLLASGKPTGTM